MPFDFNSEAPLPPTAPSETEKPIVTLRRLLERPEQWSQRYFHEVLDGGVHAYCLRGAIHHVTGGSCMAGYCVTGQRILLDDEKGASRHNDDGLEFILRLAIGYFTKQRYDAFDLVAWNDDPSRTHAEILRVIDLVIAWSEKREWDKLYEAEKF